MSHPRSWQQALDDTQHADSIARRAQQIEQITQTHATKCYGCRSADATQWIRSASLHFSAPRCDGCGSTLVATFTARGVTDVTVDTIRRSAEQ